LAVGYIQIQIKKALRLQHRQVLKVEVLEVVLKVEVPSRKGKAEAEAEAQALE
jgi:hypothetical protein